MNSVSLKSTSRESVKTSVASKSFAMKLRTFRDVLLSCVILTCLFPVLVILVIVLVREGRPIIYQQQRVGEKGRHFYVLKFRTMVPNADALLENLFLEDEERRREWEKDQKLKSDPRITAVGRFLRKTSLDEIPQLINVIKGEMSLVGPRPVLQEELVKYGRSSRFYLKQKPGITGLWQVSGRNDISYRRRVAMDRLYATRGGFFMDFIILLRTIFTVLRPRGAY